MVLGPKNDEDGSPDPTCRSNHLNRDLCTIPY
jgi:hypothetical protein